MPATGIVWITDTSQYIPKVFVFLKKTTEDYLQQTIGEIIEILKYSLNTIPLFYYRDATKNAINHISHIV